MFSTLSHLGDIPVEQFLEEYWQKKPLLVRNAFPEIPSLIDPDELAGLALDDDVVSRLAVENISSDEQTPSSWELEHGPLDEDRFSTLPASHWTLLIQHADSLDPNINDLLNAFRFIPNWRLDDIMASYAPDRGGVGPHFDYFDVFLLQGEGQRRWRLGQRCDEATPLVPDQPMKILQDFTTTEDWIVNPGDLLYIPAQLAHWGEAVGESITYSIGFRAPSYSDIVLDFSQECASKFSEHQRYRDTLLVKQEHIGEITPAVVEQFKDILTTQLQDTDLLAKWIGEYSTQLKQELPETDDTSVSEEMLSHNYPCQLTPFARSAFHSEGGENKLMCRLFINGNSYKVSHELAQKLSANITVVMSEFDIADQMVLRELANEQLLVTL